MRLHNQQLGQHLLRNLVLIIYRKGEVGSQREGAEGRYTPVQQLGQHLLRSLVLIIYREGEAGRGSGEQSGQLLGRVM